MHFNFNHAIALTGFTAAAFDVEAEAAGLVATRPGFLGAGKQLAHRGKNTGIGRRVGAGRAPDG